MRTRLRDPTILALAALGAVFFVLLWTRLVGLDQSFWHDEVSAVRDFTRHGPIEIVTDLKPGNHVLFDLFAWATTDALGHSEGLYRLWSVLPAIAAVALVTWWCWRRLGLPAAAVLFAFLITASPFHLELMKQARGYGLAMFAGTVMLVTAHWALRGGGNRALGGFSAAGLAGIATFPPFGLSFLVQGLALLTDARIRRLRFGRILAVLSAGALLAFVVLIGTRVTEVPGERARRSAYVFATESMRDLFEPTFGLLFRLPEGDLAIQIGLALAAIGLVALWLRGERPLVALLSLPVVATYGFASLFAVPDAERFFSFLMPYALLPIAVGATELVSWPIRALRPRVPLLADGLAGAAIAVAAFGLFIGLDRTIERGQREAAVPAENFKEAAELVRGSEAKVVFTNGAPLAGLRHYLDGTDQKLLGLSPKDLGPLFCVQQGPFAYVEHTIHNLPADPGCLQQRGGVRIPTASSRRPMVVWLVGAGDGQRLVGGPEG